MMYFLHTRLLALLSVVTVSLHSAADTKLPGQIVPSSLSQEQIALQREARERLISAKTLAESGDARGAEELLASALSARPNTASWHRSLASHLTHLANELTANGKGTSTDRLRLSAVSHLNQAYQVARSPVERAAIKYSLGLIYERYLGDSASADAAYEAAAALAPEIPVAKEAIERRRRQEKRLTEIQATRS